MTAFSISSRILSYLICPNTIIIIITITIIIIIVVVDVIITLLIYPEFKKHHSPILIIN